MIRIFGSFFALWSVLILMFVIWQHSDKNTKWHIMRTIVFCGMVSLITVAILVTIVALF